MTEPFERWELPARLALGDQGIGYHLANPIIADVRAHCEFSGQNPYDAFGSPEEFALAAAADQPAHLRENVDRHGMLPTDYLSGTIFILVLLGTATAVFYAILGRTLSFAATPAFLTGLIMIGLALFAGSVPRAVRASGHPRLANWTLTLVGLFGALSVASFMLLPKEPVIRVPLLAIVTVSMLLLWLMTRQPARPKQPVEYAPPTPRTAPADDTAAWCQRLSGLLVGRYDLPPQRAAELAREAHDHLTATGNTPTAEFGPVEEYARDLAQHEPERKLPFWSGTGAQLVAALATINLGILAFNSWTDEGQLWAAYGVALPATAAAIYAAIRLGLRLLKRR
ncbi:hypothetical protein ACQPYA_06220 [Micromonospora sp. CA-263727]|uniref:hypothetical protein n=1 Tax=Micromonospora sp. CA-263727 TaxID=3239967 RepID=UPI003D8DFC55